jgi:hypothetical protein
VGNHLSIKKVPNLVVEKWLSEQPETKRKFILIDFLALGVPMVKKQLYPKLNQFKKRPIIIGIKL